MFICGKKKSRHTFTEKNSKWIKNLIVKCKIIKLLEENTGHNLYNSGFDDTTTTSHEK